MSAAVFHRASANKKFSRIEKVPYDHPRFTMRPVPRAPFCSATYVSIAATCSDAECPFKRGPDGEPGGCFVEAEHFTRKAMAQLDAAGASATQAIAEEAAAIDGAWCRDGVPQDGARGGRDLRIHVGGDTPDEPSARTLAGAAARWRARGGGAVWTYTHSWRRIPRTAFGAIAVLASCETHWQVASARRRGYAPALVVERFPDGKRPFEVGGVRFIPCPAESLAKTCVECRLCLDVDLHAKGLGIAFQVHGDDAVRRAFQESGGSVNKTMAKLGTTSWAAIKKRVDALGLKAPTPAPKQAAAAEAAVCAPCGKIIRRGRDGVLHNKCRRCREAAGEAVKKRGARPKKPAAPSMPKKVNGARILKPRTLADVAARHASAPPADIVHLLEDKLAHHQEQAAKCEKALQALR